MSRLFHTSLALALISTLAACSTSMSPAQTDGPEVNAAAPPPPSGTYAGVYHVPTVTPDLAEAAKFPTPDVRWSVSADGIATLDYDLPRGLVGGKVDVSFSGPIDAAHSRATLTGKAGTAECSWDAQSRLQCLETMRGILPLRPDADVIRAHAAEEFAGPLADRLKVVGSFGTDPIGVVAFDPSNLTASDDLSTDAESSQEHAKRRGRGQ